MDSVCVHAATTHKVLSNTHVARSNIHTHTEWIFFFFWGGGGGGGGGLD